MEGAVYLKFVASLVFVLAILGLCAFLLRKYGGIGPAMMPQHKRRMKVLEIMPLDHKKKLFLIRHDDTEHLILTGQGHDCLISSRAATSDNANSQDIRKTA